MEQTGVPTQPIYTPLPRPQVAVSSTNTSMNKTAIASKNASISADNLNSVSDAYNKTEQRDLSKTYSFSSSDSYSSDDDSDSDWELSYKKGRAFLSKQWGDGKSFSSVTSTKNKQSC